MVSDGSQVMRERSARAWVLNGLVLCLSVSPAVRHSGDAWPRVPFFYPALWALLLAWYVWSQLRPRLRLTPVGLELLGEHARRILWSEITRIEVEDKSRLVVHLADGQRVKLPAPLQYGLIRDSHFPARVRRVTDAWAAGMGVEPQPVPEVDEPPP
ncbi:hypothetical protein [Streptomyces chiangmaiensis]|uniref:PH domain-containing protein n=1 Tax=Streptomyces chiangmaiensis TaxID=766497 RepID=A0ABU7FTT0_9ACTN|nr:hypothetical protein [Streptomyces chiangmaiensis]MED7827359.1 hypothetical protein [Streptomyces chiangmaiensis]